jgi:DNA-binding HxlR family transcriptional regulator
MCSYFVCRSNSESASIGLVAGTPGLAAGSDISGACERSDAALARAFGFLGKRWNAVILGVLGDGPAGFRQLSRAVGPISDSVLSQRFAELARAGLITRTVQAGPPVSVAYALTDCGKALLPALGQIARWAEEYLPPDRQSARTDRGLSAR